MKKYVFDFIVALAALIFALVLGIIVLKIAIDRKGDFFYKNTNQTQTSTTDTTKKKNNTNRKAADESTGTYWIGDSRFVGMDKVVDIKSTDHYYLEAKIGQGLSWFKKTALPKIEKTRQKNTALKKWRYVICLGVNDLGDLDNYIDEYKELTAGDSTIELILVSVNPVKNYPTIKNSDIENFNKKLHDACDENNWYYIDSYSKLMDLGYTTTDGLHYDNDTYQDIYDIIEEGLSDYEQEKAASKN
ncbi:MAG: hypothetical protein SPK77_05355 [Lachnospiraceae bacterium]|nr:hypothetical protein [Lachnospiraceae bacterium]